MNITKSLIDSMRATIAQLDSGEINPAHLAAKAHAVNAICKLAANRVATARLAGVKPSAEMMDFAGLRVELKAA